MIPINECKDGGFYKILSRNLSFGVYLNWFNGFIGIREKFGKEELFTEFHAEIGPPLGSVVPEKYLEQCPITYLSEKNKELFAWLKEKEMKYRSNTNAN
jgi:hypothetical protein